MDYSVEYLFIFMFGMVFMGVLLSGLMFFNDGEHTTLFGERFVRVSAEQEEVGCDIELHAVGNNITVSCEVVDGKSVVSCDNLLGGLMEDG